MEAVFGGTKIKIAASGWNGTKFDKSRILYFRSWKDRLNTVLERSSKEIMMWSVREDRP